MDEHDPRAHGATPQERWGWGLIAALDCVDQECTPKIESELRELLEMGWTLQQVVDVLDATARAAVQGATVPLPVGDWTEAVKWLAAVGQPWPECFVIADLRWHEERGLKIPGRRVGSRRWGWTERAVRRLLSEPDRWRYVPPAPQHVWWCVFEHMRSGHR